MKKLRYRIYTVRDGNGTIHFSVDYKGWIFWHSFLAFDWDEEEIRERQFPTEELALDAIRQNAFTRRAKQYTIEKCKEIVL